MADTKIYQEGNKGFLVYEFQEGGYATKATAIRGLISLEGTVSQTESKTAADDDIAYLIRRSPVTIEGTITFVGLSADDYKAFLGAITDQKGAIVYGENTAKQIGFVFLNTEHNINAEGTDTQSENAHVFYNATFSLPNISTTTIAEDDTTIRSFELSFTANPRILTADDDKEHKITYACVNSAKDANNFKYLIGKGGDGNNEYKMYIPSFKTV